MGLTMFTRRMLSKHQVAVRIAEIGKIFAFIHYTQFPKGLALEGFGFIFFFFDGRMCSRR